MDADEEEEENHDDLSPAPSAPAKKIKPPPIFVPDVSDIGGFITDVALAIGSLKFEYKSGTDGRVRVNLEDKESFSKLKSYLNENEIRYQTFQAKDERAYRIVVKGLHPSINGGIGDRVLRQRRRCRLVGGVESWYSTECLKNAYGCHIEIDPPAAEAVDHHNYKGWSSVVLFAMVDYRYRFQYVDIGAPGRCNDSYIFQSSSLSKMLNPCPLLDSKSRKICGVDVPVLLIGDSAFRFSRNLMKPYSYSTDQTIKRKTFNYNLSKSRRVVENAFGHVKARFRRVGMGLHSHPKKNAVIIMACCVLHNILNVYNSAIDEACKAALGEHDKEQPHQSNTSTDYSRPAEEIRSAIADYLCII
ncbi:hypothetical protein ACLKA7_001944 [Drosophila subpalustris]